jgi:RimJ/RimL family protein N-acetyltransferase
VAVAASRLERILTAVVAGNEQAHRLYTSVGFEEYGIARNALKQNGRYYDEILMAKVLVPSSN